MESRQVGKSGVSVTTLGLGGFEMGPEEGAEPDLDRTATVLGASLAVGLNWLDTSENYCETRNELLIGEALRRVDGDLLVATKIAPGHAVTGGGSGFLRNESPRIGERTSQRRRPAHLRGTADASSQFSAS